MGIGMVYVGSLSEEGGEVMLMGILSGYSLRRHLLCTHHYSHLIPTDLPLSFEYPHLILVCPLYSKLYPHLCFLPRRLIVVLMTEIHVFSFPENPKLLTTISTAPNPRGGCVLHSLAMSGGHCTIPISGLCEVCPSVDCKLMAFPGSQKGTVQIVVCYKSLACMLGSIL